jgi:hypothetical protein
MPLRLAFHAPASGQVEHLGGPVGQRHRDVHRIDDVWHVAVVAHRVTTAQHAARQRVELAPHSQAGCPVERLERGRIRTGAYGVHLGEQWRPRGTVRAMPGDARPAHPAASVFGQHADATRGRRSAAERHAEPDDVR